MKLHNLLLSLLTLPIATPIPSSPDGRGPGPGHMPPHHDNCPTLQTTCLCLDRSVRNFSWTLSIEYHAFWYFSTPSHQNAWGTVTFNLTNPAVASTIHCQMDSNRLSDFFYGDQWYTCVPSVAVPALAATYFKFFSHSRFELNQTWVCDDNQRKPVKFIGIAKTDLDLKCTDVTWKNPNWTSPNSGFYSTRDVKCEPAKLDLKPYEERIVL